eukprot:266252-Prorocentrum_lima.AAC.1
MRTQDMDTRDRWLGLKWLKQAYSPTPHSRRKDDGKHIGPRELPEEAATCLSTQQWAEQEG